jgi:Uma2 family endonuclease
LNCPWACGFELPPDVAPDVVVEVLSPSDRKTDIEEKIRVFLACGTNAIFLVDTVSQTVTVRDAFQARHFSREDILTHPAMPHFALRANELFDRVAPKP